MASDAALDAAFAECWNEHTITQAHVTLAFVSAGHCTEDTISPGCAVGGTGGMPLEGQTGGLVLPPGVTPRELTGAPATTG